MNRAAEAAAPGAKKIFGDAIGEMSIEDARKIWSGGDNAATQYFQSKTSDQLTAAFKPVVDQAMNQVGVTRQYKELLGRAQSIPFLRRTHWTSTATCWQEPRRALRGAGRAGKTNPHQSRRAHHRPPKEVFSASK